MIEPLRDRIHITEIVPPLQSGWGDPDWYHHHGSKMILCKEDSGHGQLVIRGSAAEVKIFPLETPDYRGQKRWGIYWTIIQTRDLEGTHGNIVVDKPTLRAAFGLEDTIDPFSAWMIRRYGGSAASQGKFIRWRDYLNIPHPGTGHDGDPNVSIELDNDIKEAIKNIYE